MHHGLTDYSANLFRCLVWLIYLYLRTVHTKEAYTMSEKTFRRWTYSLLCTCRPLGSTPTCVFYIGPNLGRTPTRRIANSFGNIRRLLCSRTRSIVDNFASSPTIDGLSDDRSSCSSRQRWVVQDSSPNISRILRIWNGIYFSTRQDMSTF